MGQNRNLEVLRNWEQNVFTRQFMWYALMLSCVWLFGTPVTVVGQPPLSMEFSSQEYWSGFPFPSLWDLPDLGSDLHLLHLLHWQVNSLPLHYLGSSSVRQCAQYSVVQSCPTFCDPMDYSPPGSFIEISRQAYWSGLPFPIPSWSNKLI